MQIPASIAAEAAITQQNVALSVIKQSAQADRQIANILEETVSASNRGQVVNIRA